MEKSGINLNKLRGRIVEHGLTIEELAQRMDIHPSTFYRRMHSSDGFTVGELQKMLKILKLSAKDISDIFFGGGVA